MGGVKRAGGKWKQIPVLRFLVSFFMLLIFLNLAMAQNDQPRWKMTINDGWKFHPGDVTDAEIPALDDADWEQVRLPHTWNAADAFAKTGEYYRGAGWYRKRLRLDPALRDRRLYLYFEGANQMAAVFCNGEKLGEHIGGYSAFVFEITELVQFEQPNLLAVRVDNSHHPDIPPLNADFTFYGGIYRDVWLVATHPVHIEMLDHASPGVFISTPEISSAAATVQVRGAVRNDSDALQTIAVRQRILDPAGREVTRFEQGLTVPAGEARAFSHSSGTIANPQLWSPDAPHLYRVFTEVLDGSRVLDRVENPLGFRWFSVDAQRGFFLNDKPLKLYGTNRHQDVAGYGNAVPDPLHRRDVQLIKNDGFNFLRLAHYPQDPAVLAEADRLGLLVWEETPVVNLITLSEAFNRNCERMLTEMIRQHYNHPSIVMWGYMNEVMLRPPDPVPEGYYQSLLALVKRLEAKTKSEDPTRLTVTAQSGGEIFNGKGVSEVPDILGMNLYFGWYVDDFYGLGKFLDNLHREHPGRPLMISEYGAGSDERVHAANPRRFDFSTEYQQQFHETHFRQILARDYLVGSAIWNQFDFGSSHRQDTKNAINQKGIYYFDRTPKDIAAFYRAHLRDEPVVHIAARDYPRRAGSRTHDSRCELPVYSNLPEVELLLNGASLGKKTPENCTIRWQIALRNGANRLRARGYWNGTPVEDAFVIHFEDRRGFYSDANSPVREVAVNSGSHYVYIDNGGMVWEADHSDLPHPWGFTGGEAKRTHHRIYLSDDDPLFQSARVGAETVRFSVPDGSYSVELGFAEIEHKLPGQRIFGVLVNGQPAVTALDLAADFGQFVAVRRRIETAAGNGNGIEIRFVPEVGRALVNAIRIYRNF